MHLQNANTFSYLHTLILAYTTRHELRTKRLFLRKHHSLNIQQHDGESYSNGNVFIHSYGSSKSCFYIIAYSLLICFLRQKQKSYACCWCCRWQRRCIVADFKHVIESTEKNQANSNEIIWIERRQTNVGKIPESLQSSFERMQHCVTLAYHYAFVCSICSQISIVTCGYIAVCISWQRAINYTVNAANERCILCQRDIAHTLENALKTLWNIQKMHENFVFFFAWAYSAL